MDDLFDSLKNVIESERLAGVEEIFLSASAAKQEKMTLEKLKETFVSCHAQAIVGNGYAFVLPLLAEVFSGRLSSVASFVYHRGNNDSSHSRSSCKSSFRCRTKIDACRSLTVWQIRDVLVSAGARRRTSVHRDGQLRRLFLAILS